jgi:hypothetical protein
MSVIGGDDEGDDDDDGDNSQYLLNAFYVLSF